MKSDLRVPKPATLSTLTLYKFYSVTHIKKYKKQLVHVIYV